MHAQINTFHSVNIVTHTEKQAYFFHNFTQNSYIHIFKYTFFSYTE